MLVPLLLATVISSVVAQSGHPNFDLLSEYIVLEEGALEKVECVAKGELPLIYTWYNQRDAVITSDEKKDVFTRQSGNGSFLIFDHVESSHAGLYSCSASNKHGTALKLYDIIVNSTSGNITTNETAEIVEVEVLNITENSVEFVVQTKGDPDSFYITYEGTLDREEKWVQIKKGEKAVVKNLVPYSRYAFWFQIESPSRGKSSSTPYYVTLLPGVPEFIFRNIRDGTVDLEWSRSIDDSYRLSIEEYELSYNRIQQVEGRYWEASDSAITIKIPRYGRTARYTIAGLERGFYYEIRLRVRTDAGFGKPYANKIFIL